MNILLPGGPTGAGEAPDATGISSGPQTKRRRRDMCIASNLFESGLRPQTRSLFESALCPQTRSQSRSDNSKVAVRFNARWAWQKILSRVATPESPGSRLRRLGINLAQILGALGDVACPTQNRFHSYAL